MAKDELLAVAESVDDDAGGPEENASEEPVVAVVAAGGGAANMVDSYTRKARITLFGLRRFCWFTWSGQWLWRRLERRSIVRARVIERQTMLRGLTKKDIAMPLPLGQINRVTFRLTPMIY